MNSRLLILLWGKGRNSAVSLQKYEQSSSFSLQKYEQSSSLSLQKYDKVVQQYQFLEIGWLISFNWGVKPKNLYGNKLSFCPFFHLLKSTFPVKFPCNRWWAIFENPLILITKWFLNKKIVGWEDEQSSQFTAPLAIKSHWNKENKSFEIKVYLLEAIRRYTINCLAEKMVKLLLYIVFPVFL